MGSKRGSGKHHQDPMLVLPTIPQGSAPAAKNVARGEAGTGGPRRSKRNHQNPEFTMARGGALEISVSEIPDDGIESDVVPRRSRRLRDPGLTEEIGEMAAAAAAALTTVPVPEVPENIKVGSKRGSGKRHQDSMLVLPTIPQGSSPAAKNVAQGKSGTGGPRRSKRNHQNPEFTMARGGASEISVAEIPDVGIEADVVPRRSRRLIDPGLTEKIGEMAAAAAALTTVPVPEVPENIEVGSKRGSGKHHQDPMLVLPTFPQRSSPAAKNVARGESGTGGPRRSKRNHQNPEFTMARGGASEISVAEISDVGIEADKEGSAQILDRQRHFQKKPVRFRSEEIDDGVHKDAVEDKLQRHTREYTPEPVDERISTRTCESKKRHGASSNARKSEVLHSGKHLRRSKCNVRTKSVIDSLLTEDKKSEDDYGRTVGGAVLPTNVSIKTTRRGTTYAREIGKITGSFEVQENSTKVINYDELTRRKRRRSVIKCDVAEQKISLPQSEKPGTNKDLVEKKCSWETENQRSDKDCQETFPFSDSIIDGNLVMGDVLYSAEWSQPGEIIKESEHQGSENIFTQEEVADIVLQDVSGELGSTESLLATEVPLEKPTTGIEPDRWGIQQKEHDKPEEDMKKIEMGSFKEDLQLNYMGFPAFAKESYSLCDKEQKEDLLDSPPSNTRGTVEHSHSKEKSSVRESCDGEVKSLFKETSGRASCCYHCPEEDVGPSEKPDCAQLNEHVIDDSEGKASTDMMEMQLSRTQGRLSISKAYDRAVGDDAHKAIGDDARLSNSFKERRIENVTQSPFVDVQGNKNPEAPLKGSETTLTSGDAFKTGDKLSSSYDAMHDFSTHGVPCVLEDEGNKLNGNSLPSPLMRSGDETAPDEAVSATLARTLLLEKDCEFSSSVGCHHVDPAMDFAQADDPCSSHDLSNARKVVEELTCDVDTKENIEVDFNGDFSGRSFNICGASDTKVLSALGGEFSIPRPPHPTGFEEQVKFAHIQMAVDVEVPDMVATTQLDEELSSSQALSSERCTVSSDSAVGPLSNQCNHKLLCETYNLSSNGCLAGDTVVEIQHPENASDDIVEDRTDPADLLVNTSGVKEVKPVLNETSKQLLDKIVDNEDSENNPTNIPESGYMDSCSITERKSCGVGLNKCGETLEVIKDAVGNAEMLGTEVSGWMENTTTKGENAYQSTLELEETETKGDQLGHIHVPSAVKTPEVQGNGPDGKCTARAAESSFHVGKLPHDELHSIWPKSGHMNLSAKSVASPFVETEGDVSEVAEMDTCLSSDDRDKERLLLELSQHSDVNSASAEILNFAPIIPLIRPDSRTDYCVLQDKEQIMEHNLGKETRFEVLCTENHHDFIHPSGNENKDEKTDDVSEHNPCYETYPEALQTQKTAGDHHFTAYSENEQDCSYPSGDILDHNPSYETCPEFLPTGNAVSGHDVIDNREHEKEIEKVDGDVTENNSGKETRFEVLCTENHHDFIHPSGNENKDEKTDDVLEHNPCYETYPEALQTQKAAGDHHFTAYSENEQDCSHPSGDILDHNPSYETCPEFLPTGNAVSGHDFIDNREHEKEIEKLDGDVTVNNSGKETRFEVLCTENHHDFIHPSGNENKDEKTDDVSEHNPCYETYPEALQTQKAAGDHHFTAYSENEQDCSHPSGDILDHNPSYETCPEFLPTGNAVSGHDFIDNREHEKEIEKLDGDVTENNSGHEISLGARQTENSVGSHGFVNLTKDERKGNKPNMDVVEHKSNNVASSVGIPIESVVCHNFVDHGGNDTEDDQPKRCVSEQELSSEEESVKEKRDNGNDKLIVVTPGELVSVEYDVKLLKGEKPDQISSNLYRSEVYETVNLMSTNDCKDHKEFENEDDTSNVWLPEEELEHKTEHGHFLQQNGDTMVQEELFLSIKSKIMADDGRFDGTLKHDITNYTEVPMGDIQIALKQILDIGANLEHVSGCWDLKNTVRDMNCEEVVGTVQDHEAVEMWTEELQAQDQKEDLQNVNSFGNPYCQDTEDGPAYTKEHEAVKSYSVEAHNLGIIVDLEPTKDSKSSNWLEDDSQESNDHCASILCTTSGHDQERSTCKSTGVYARGGGEVGEFYINRQRLKGMHHKGMEIDGNEDDEKLQLPSSNELVVETDTVVGDNGDDEEQPSVSKNPNIPNSLGESESASGSPLDIEKAENEALVNHFTYAALSDGAKQTPPNGDSSYEDLPDSAILSEVEHLALNWTCLDDNPDSAKETTMISANEMNTLTLQTVVEEDGYCREDGATTTGEWASCIVEDAAASPAEEEKTNDAFCGLQISTARNHTITGSISSTSQRNPSSNIFLQFENGQENTSCSNTSPSTHTFDDK